MSATRTFYIGAANDGSIPRQSQEDDAEGMQGLFHLMGIPTFTSEEDLWASRNPDFTGPVNAIKITVEVGDER